MPRNYDIRKFGPENDESRQGFPSKGTGQILNELGNLIFRSSIRAYSSAAGVQVVEAWVLRKIGYKKVISAREIAVVMSADEGQISRVIKSLLDKKLIARTQDPNYGDANSFGSPKRVNARMSSSRRSPGHARNDSWRTSAKRNTVDSSK